MQLFEYFRHSRKIKQEVVKEPVFILGHPRSGTTHLHYLMSQDEQFGYCTVYEGLLPHVFLTGGAFFKKIIKNSLPETRPQDEVKIAVDSPKEEEFPMAVISTVSYLFGFYFPKNTKKNFEKSVLFNNDLKSKKRWQKNYKYYLQKLTYAKRCKQLILKSPANTGRIKEILEVFPDAKFVHIHRDPIEVFQSTVKLYEKVIPLTSFQKVESDEIEQFIIDSYRLMYEKYFKNLELLNDGQLVEIEYVDLLKNPLKEIKGIYNGLGLDNFDSNMPFFEKELSKTSNYKRNSYKEISPELLKRLKKEWGDIIEELGYKLP